MPPEHGAVGPDQAAGTARFGLRIAGVPLLLPEEPLEHVASAVVHPLPGAGRRVVGLAQLRGHPVVVVDPGDAAPSARPAELRAALLVIGVPPDAGALLVQAPPQPVRIGEPRPDAPPPEAPFAAALDGAFADADDPAGVWWHFEARRLLALLAAA